MNIEIKKPAYFLRPICAQNSLMRSKAKPASTPMRKVSSRPKSQQTVCVASSVQKVGAMHERFSSRQIPLVGGMKWVDGLPPVNPRPRVNDAVHCFARVFLPQVARFPPLSYQV